MYSDETSSSSESEEDDSGRFSKNDHPKFTLFANTSFSIFQPLAIHFRVDYSDMEAE